MDDELVEYEQMTGDNADIDAPDGGLSRDVFRLLVGGTLAGSSLLLSWLRGAKPGTGFSESEQKQPTPEQEVEDLEPTRMRYAALGLTFRTVEVARKGVSAAIGVASIALKPVKAVMISPPLPRAPGPFDKLVEKGRSQIEGLIQVGELEEKRSKGIAENTVNQAVAGVVDYFADNQKIQELIRAQVDLLSKDIEHTPQIDVIVRVVAENYINYLIAHPEQIQILIHSQAGDYIGYLNENPETIQKLLTGQSISLAGEITEEVRQVTVTLDSLLEMIPRRILRKTERSGLPEPPPQVMARALYGNLLGGLASPEGREP